MIRETSAEAYKEIKENGLLSDRRWQVYEALYAHGPLTGGELSEKLPKKISRTIGSNVHARLAELRDSGVVKELGTRFCSISGQRVILWDVTKHLPKDFKRPRTRKCDHCNGTGKISMEEYF